MATSSLALTQPGEWLADTPSSSTRPYSRTSMRATSEFRLRRLVRLHGKNGEGMGGSSLSSTLALHPLLTVTVGVGAGRWGTGGVGRTVVALAGWQGDWKGVGRLVTVRSVMQQTYTHVHNRGRQRWF